MTFIEFGTLFLQVKSHMHWDDAKTFLWFDKPNPNFGGVSANELIAMGRGHKVKQFVEGAIEESARPIIARLR